jgi:peptidoglycan-associated lipoprotein
VLEQLDLGQTMNNTKPQSELRARRPLLAFLALGLAAALAAGCGSDAERPPKTADETAKAPSAATPAAKPAAAKPDTASPTSGSIQIDDKILKACGDIPTARFAFDSASLGPDANAALEALARCFVSGPLKGRSMRLVGHADPRGETEYNLGLGQKRAGSVADFLATKGLDKARIQTLSKGAFEATGTDEQGWARDRKVEVALVE